MAHLQLSGCKPALNSRSWSRKGPPRGHGRQQESHLGQGLPTPRTRPQCSGCGPGSPALGSGGGGDIWKGPWQAGPPSLTPPSPDELLYRARPVLNPKQAPVTQPGAGGPSLPAPSSRAAERPRSHSPHSGLCPRQQDYLGLRFYCSKSRQEEKRFYLGNFSGRQRRAERDGVLSWKPRLPPW